jgi:hypothetical protein
MLISGATLKASLMQWCRWWNGQRRRQILSEQTNQNRSAIDNKNYGKIALRPGG